MKKFTKFLLVGFIALTLVACGSSSDSGDKTVKVGLAIYKYDDVFMTTYRTELESYFKEKGKEDGVTYEVKSMDGKNDQVEQQNQIENFIADKVDVIIANLVEPANADIILQKAKAADIPVIFINREPTEKTLKGWEGKAAYVGAKAQQSGEYQGEMVAELENKGDYNGDGKLGYVMIMGDPQNVDAQQRTEFSIKKYGELSDIPVNKLVEQRGDWDQPKGQEIAANALTQFGDEIDVIFCNNDNMALGALQSIKSAGRTVGKDIALVGVDALDEAQKAVQNGEMTGTVLNDGVNQSHKAVDVAIDAVNGKKIDSYYWIDYVKVTTDYFKK